MGDVACEGFVGGGFCCAAEKERATTIAKGRMPNRKRLCAKDILT